jgi:hypothetical protein
MTIGRPECPKCECDKAVPIAYGFTSAELIAEAQQGKVHLGGCCILDEDCGHEWREEAGPD